MTLSKATLALCSLALATGIAASAVDRQDGSIEHATSAQSAPTNNNSTPDTATSVASLR